MIKSPSRVAWAIAPPCERVVGEVEELDMGGRNPECQMPIPIAARLTAGVAVGRGKDAEA